LLHNLHIISANERYSSFSKRSVENPTVFAAMIAPVLILQRVAAGILRRSAMDFGASISEFVSTFDHRLSAIGLPCVDLLRATGATGTVGIGAAGEVFIGSVSLISTDPILLPAMAYPPPSATVSSWQWIT